MPPYRRVLIIVVALGVIAGAMHEQIARLYRWFLPATATVQLRDVDGTLIPLAGRADVFAIDRTVYLSSPMPLLGSVDLAALGDTLELDGNRFPQSMQIRFHVPGYGVDYMSAELGKRRTFKLTLGPPMSVVGRVTAVGGKPVKGATVLGIGAHPRGVILSETKTDERGHFSLDNISSRTGNVFVRVLAEGFALAEIEHDWRAVEKGRAGNPEFELVPVPPLHGKVQLPAELEGILQKKTLRVSVFQHPGVSAAVLTDGRFIMHHLAGGKNYRTLLQGLPPGFTHRVVYAQPGQRCTIDVVPAVTLRGRVVSRRGTRGFAKTEVWHQDTTRGNEKVYTDGYGRFALPNVPKGTVSLQVVVPDSPNYPNGVSIRRKVDVPAAGAGKESVVRID